MDWNEIDLTMEAIIGGDYQPNMLSWQVRHDRSRDIYMDLFREDREHILRIVGSDELDREEVIRREREAQEEDNVSNAFMSIFGRFPKWLTNKHAWLNTSIAGGDGCDRCGVTMNLLNSSYKGCCDQCELEIKDHLATHPDVVFAFDSGGLRAVA